jgi:cytochrome c5
MFEAPRVVPTLLIALTSVLLLASCGGMGGMMRQPSGVEGSLDEMSVGEFYQANCAACHGGQRQGSLGPALVPSRLTEGDEFYMDAIANGRPGTAMPAWGGLGLTDSDIAVLVEFIRTEP